MKIRNKIAAISLISLLDTGLAGCGSTNIFGEEQEVKILESENIFDNTTNVSNEIEETEEVEETETTESEEEKESVEMYSVPTIVATTNVNVRDCDDNVIGVLAEGQDLENLGKSEDNNYLVNWYGTDGCVSVDYVVESTKCEIVSPIKKVLYVPTDITLIIPSYLSEDGLDHEVTIPENECLEVYNEIDEYYLVATSDYVGYVPKYTILEELNGTFVVVDISDQELKLYKDNEVILTSPVVTGKPSTPTTEGLFEIYDISYSRYLIGPNYRSYVDIMMKFNGGEGLHDAEYHTCDKSHGWRTSSEFGGDTYLTDGSHGCVNMLHDDVFTVSDYVDLGTKVLIKK